MRARFKMVRGFRLGSLIPVAAAAVLLAGGVQPSRAGIGSEQPQAANEENDPHSLLGSYLAGRIARTQNDTDAAARYYREALIRDPANEVLVENAFLMETTEGNWAEATRLGRMLVEKQPTHRTAHAFIGLVDFARADYDAADRHFIAASANPIGELTSALSRAWTLQAQGKTQEALTLLDAPKQPEWAQYYLRYHRALIADLAGRTQDARAAWDKIPKNDLRALRIALGYARHLARNGDAKAALNVLKTQYDKAKNDGHPIAKALYEEIEAGRKPGLMIATPRQGLAEVYYGLGEALTGEGGVSVGIVYLQLALYLEPEQPFALATLGTAYEAVKRYRAAIAAYDRIPRGGPMQSQFDIRRALNLERLDDVDGAQKLLEQVAKQEPKDIRPLDALGTIMRARKRYAEAAEYYTKLIALIDKPEAKHWTYYYARGTCYERLKKMSLAEADLRKSLQLSPDQAMALNYLGYTWIDQNRNLKEGLALIEKAERQKPDDGYIVDSLGWAYFRLGRFKDAEKHLERAVELRPEDPVLNDHLGDAYWRVGREREARFQWEQALTLNPEPEEIDKIKLKIEKGLPPLPQAKQNVKRTREVQTRKEAQKKSTSLTNTP